MSRILIVDDDVDICFAMSAMLIGKGFDVAHSHDGNAAMDLLRTECFDLVILDIFMPEKDGLETIGEIRRLNTTIKIIAMSGYDKSRFNPLEYARSLGANEALAKPFSADKLLDCIQDLLSETPQPQET
ncbi:MAG: response regulator [Methylocystaceae bacterium]|nr:response regulator [Methylocystaceae bacterium]